MTSGYIDLPVSSGGGGGGGGPVQLQDGAGNPITSQVSGSQRALDVGIDVAGVQIDPRQIRALTSADVVTIASGSKTQIVDGSGNVVGLNQLVGGIYYMPVIQPASATTGSAVPSRSLLIAGSDGTNARNLSTDSSGHLNVNDLPLNSSGAYGAITVGTSAVLAAAGGSNLSNRTQLLITNNSSAVIYFGTDSSVTTTSGTPMAANQTASFNIGSSLSIYLIAGSAGNNVRILEAL